MSTLKVTHLQNENGTGPAMSIAVGGGVTFAGITTFHSNVDLGSNSLSGDLTGNVTGNLTGNVTGNLTGNVTGNLTGDVTVATGATVSGSTNTITASTNGEERLRITSDGKIGIGSDNPTVKLSIGEGFDTTSSSGYGVGNKITEVANNNTGCIQLQASGFNNAYYPVLEIYNGSTRTAHFKADGNLVLQNGSGIDFSATAGPTNGTDTNEVLNNYEEGNWTPTFNGAFTVSSYSTQSGYYTKVGRLVNAFARIRVLAANLSSPTSSTIGVQGLPYAIYNTSDHYPTGRGYGNLVGSAENAFLIGFPSQTTAYFYKSTTDGYISISGNTIGTSGDIDYLFSITYQSA